MTSAVDAEVPRRDHRDPRLDRRLPGAVRLRPAAGREEPEGGRASSRSAWPTEWQFWQNLVEVLQKNDYQVLWAFLNSADPHDRQLSPSWSCSPRWSATCCSASARGWNPLVNFLVLAGAHRSARRGADDLGAAGHRPVQDDARHDPHRGHLRALVLHPAVPGVRRHHPQGARRSRDHRRRRAAPAVLRRGPAAAASR